MTERQKASPEMQKFFEKLLSLKKFVKEEMAKKRDSVLDEIYKKLDETIVTTDEL